MGLSLRKNSQYGKLIFAQWIMKHWGEGRFDTLHIQ